jgi:hypothetical protein
MNRNYSDAEVEHALARVLANTNPNHHAFPRINPNSPSPFNYAQTEAAKRMEAAEALASMSPNPSNREVAARNMLAMANSRGGKKRRTRRRRSRRGRRRSSSRRRQFLTRRMYY